MVHGDRIADRLDDVLARIEADLEGKFRMCAEGAIDDAAQARLLDMVKTLETMSNATALSEAMVYDSI